MPKDYFKKTLAGIFAVALVASSIPLAPYTKVLDSISITASATAAPASYFEYDIENDEAIITSYNGPDNIDLEIPSEIEGKPVTKLDWFLDTHFLNKIIVPDTVKTIEGSGFFGATVGTGGAEEIVIPASVTSIVDLAFDYQANPVVYYGGSKEQWLEINEDDDELVTEYLIMHYYDGTHQGFSYTYDDATEGLKITGYSGTDTDVVIPAEIAGAPVTAIGTAAFINFTALESVELPDTVETIGHQAFRNCKELDTVTIPSSVTSIGINSFNGCASLKSISIPESVTSISDYTFASCSLLASVKMGSKVESIGKSAFDGCANLKSIEIPDSVTSIGNYSFRGCSALTSVKIGKGVTSIGSQVFSGCIGLTSITFPNSVTSIGAQVCSGCTGLTSITFGSSVASIGMGALYNCSSLTSISFNGDMPNEINTNAFVGIGTVETPVSLFYPTDNQTWDGIEEAVHSKKWNGGYFEAMTAVIKGYSVSYNGDITINFHYLLSDSYKNGYVEFSDGTQVIASVSAFEVKDANGYYVFPISMPAKNMYDEITAQFYDENDVAIGDAVTFKMADYLSAVKEAAPNTACAAFVDSFLEYGAQAAAYFGVTGAPAGKTYSDSDFKDISNALEANYASTNNMGDTFVGATLLLKSTPKLRLYYSEDPGNYSTNEKNPDLFYTEKEISPVKFGTEDLNGYYVYNYIYKAMNSDDSGLKALCAALYNMSEAIPYNMSEAIPVVG